MIDPKLLRSFLAVCDLQSFSRAAKVCDVSQPTVSQHVQRLEQMAKTPLFTRNSSGVELTSAGEALRRLALDFEAAHQAIIDLFQTEQNLSRIRFGAADDFSTTQLPQILQSFTRAHPNVALSLTVQEYAPLIDSLKNEELDLVLVKQFSDHLMQVFDGSVILVDELAWVVSVGNSVDVGSSLPLVTYKEPSMTRKRVIDVLNSEHFTWHPTCECQGFSGITAAIRAGLGVGVLPRSLVPDDLMVCPTRWGLPDLGEVQFVLLRRHHLQGKEQVAVESLAKVIQSSVFHNL